MVESLLKVDPIKPLDMRLSNERRSETDSSFLRDLTRESRVRKNILVQERRRLEEDDIVGRELREKVVVDGVEVVFRLLEGLRRSAFCCAGVISKYVDDYDVVFVVSSAFDMVERLL